MVSVQTQQQLLDKASKYDVICVDLDGTLIIEHSHKQFIKHNIFMPHRLIKAGFLRFIGIFSKNYHVKAKEYTSKFPFKYTLRTWLIDILYDLQAQGKHICISTGSHEIIAKQFCKQLNFNSYISTSHQTYPCIVNLKNNKLANMQHKFPKHNFFYIGDSIKQDLPILNYLGDGCIINKYLHIKLKPHNPFSNIQTCLPNQHQSIKALNQNILWIPD